MSQDGADTQGIGLAEDWPALFDAHDVQFLVLDIEQDGDLARCFRSHPGWRVDFADAQSMLLARAPFARANAETTARNPDFCARVSRVKP
jgi:hypothetical protein